MTLPGFVDEEDQLKDGKRIQRLLSHMYELPSLVDPEDATNNPAGERPGHNPTKNRSAAGRKSAKRRLASGGRCPITARREK